MVFDIRFPEKIQFGAGKLRSLPSIISGFGRKVLIVTGGSSFSGSSHWPWLSGALGEHEVDFETISIPAEPSPEIIDKAVRTYSENIPDVVVAVGGGSAMDAGKAISAMLTVKEPVIQYLEGVGDGRQHPGTKVPFVAVPTTAGTGSEVTKNAVISRVGTGGFKKSLRHDRFVPDIALVDPVLTLQCPPHITAWSGMDAFTQLLESYLSTKANPMTDSLALSGLKMISEHLEQVVDDGQNQEARSGMAYAALCSGITLANAGLGTIHGFASSIGGRFAVPHGLVCASLMGPCNEMTFGKLIKQDAEDLFVRKYARVGKLFFGSNDRDEVFYAEFLINKIHDLIQKFDIPKLSSFGFEFSEMEAIARATSNKNNPVQLTADERLEVLEKVV